MTKRQQQITEALDLNKNQAPNQTHCAQASEVAEEAIQQVETPAKKLDQRNGHNVESATRTETATPSRRKHHRTSI